MSRAVASVVLLIAGWLFTAPAGPVQFVFTSDSHYGLTRPAFRNATNVSSHAVNQALVSTINALPTARFPRDGGLRQTEVIGGIDFVAHGGDIANRQEEQDGLQVQPASASWAEFETDYIRGLTLTTTAGAATPLYVVPGNHEMSNAMGFFRPMTPPSDPTALVAIFNRMMRPDTPRTAATVDVARDRVLTTRDVGPLHLVFVTVWPDSAARAWLERDLASVSADRPVVVFAHDQPESEAKHFVNPNGAHDINARDKFENLVTDTFASGTTIDTKTTTESRALEQFLRRHPNVTAYFHGNANWNQFYDWTGPDHTVALHTFRVDSPMKGAASGRDERLLSFQVATVDTEARTLTVRECLWNQEPRSAAPTVAWGASTTVALMPRPAVP